MALQLPYGTGLLGTRTEAPACAAVLPVSGAALQAGRYYTQMSSGYTMSAGAGGTQGASRVAGILWYTPMWWMLCIRYKCRTRDLQPALYCGKT